MWAETLWNNENFHPIEKKEINYDDFLKWLEKSNKQVLQIRELEQKDKKQEEQEINLFELYFDWNLSEAEFKDKLLTLSTQEKTEVSKNNIDNQQEIQQNKKNEDIKISNNPLKLNEKYGEFNKYTEIKEIAWKEVIIFNDEIVNALNRYELNKEPLINLLWREKVNIFIELIESDYWKELINNTNYFKKLNEIWSNLQIVNFEQNKDWQKLTKEIFEETQILALEIHEIQEQLNSELKHLMQSVAKQNNTMACHVPYRELFSNKLNEKYEPLINSKLEKYTKNILEKIVLSDSSIWVIKNWQKVELPVWQKDIILDFSKLWDNINFENISKQDLLKQVQEKFDDIYINTLWEKISHNIEKAYNYAKAHPEKLTVDIVSIVVSWIVAIWTVWVVSSSTWWLWTIPSIAIAWTSFTVTDNTIRSLWYWLISEAWFDSIDWKKWFKEWFYEWLWIDGNDILSKKNITKKWFELLTNTALFWVFKLSSKAQNLILQNLEKSWAEKTLNIFKKFTNEYTKTIPEAMFFTEFWLLASSIEESIIKIQDTKNINREEAFEMLKQETQSLHTPEKMLEYFAYNLWFIWLVKIWIHKWWWQFIENKVNNLLNFKESGKIKQISDELNREILKLESEWIAISRKINWELVFYDKKMNILDNSVQELNNFYVINKKLTQQVIDSQKILTKPPKDDTTQNPNSWKWTKAQANKIALDRKYQKLERLSAKTEKEWLNFALWEKWFSKDIKNKWITEWTKEWLIKKSWFTESEAKALKDYEARKWSKELKDRAVERMNTAVERVIKETDVLRIDYLSYKKLNKNTDVLFNKYDKNIRKKIENLLFISL